MKRKTLCQSGNTVFRWYDRRTRSTVVRTLDSLGNQLGEADYSGNKQSADFAHVQAIKANGGESSK